MTPVPINLYADRMMTVAPHTAEDVWSATRDHPKLYGDAASKIGLTPAEYREFRSALLDGKAIYVRLPSRVEAMAGNHRGKPYALRNVVMRDRVMGWEVALSDGTTVLIPQVCGNLSLVHRPHIAKARKTPASSSVAVAPAPETPVTLAPPQPLVAAAATAPVAAPITAPVALPAAHSARFPIGLLFPLIGAIGGGISNGVTTVSQPQPPVIPPCNQGSNAIGVCQGPPK